jgi:uncharacterized OsmC-like protein
VASSAFAALPISLAEADPNPRESTPGELLAAALAGYLGMHLALGMQRDGSPLRELVVEVQLTVSPWPSYTTQAIGFSVRGRGGGGEEISSDAFASVAQKTLDTAMANMGLGPGLTRLDEAELI